MRLVIRANTTVFGRLTDFHISVFLDLFRGIFGATFAGSVTLGDTELLIHNKGYGAIFKEATPVEFPDFLGELHPPPAPTLPK
jgi:hypothetical protein